MTVALRSATENRSGPQQHRGGYGDGLVAIEIEISQPAGVRAELNTNVLRLIAEEVADFGSRKMEVLPITMTWPFLPEQNRHRVEVAHRVFERDGLRRACGWPVFP